MSIKNKLFLLLTLVLCILPFQNSFGAYTDKTADPVAYNCASLENGKIAINNTTGNLILNNFNSDDMCVFTRSSVSGKWDAPSGCSQYGLDVIKVPFSLASDNTIWNTINDSINYINNLLSDPKKWLKPVLYAPNTYDNIKKAIITSCLPGSITTSNSGITIPVYKGGYCGGHWNDDSKESDTMCYQWKSLFNNKCNGGPYALPYSSFSSWSTVGCGPLDQAVSMTVDKQPTVSGDYHNGRIEVEPNQANKTITLKWSSANQDATCSVSGKNPMYPASDTDNTIEKLKAPITSKDFAIDPRSGNNPKPATVTRSITFQKILSGAYTFTLNCAGVANGQSSSAPGTVTKSITVYTTDMPAEPKINDFSFVEVNGQNNLQTYTGTVSGVSYSLALGNSFGLKWSADNINSDAGATSINIYQSKGGSEIPLYSSNIKDNSNDVLEVTPDKTGIYTYRIEVSGKYAGLGKAKKELKIQVIPPLAPTISAQFINSSGAIITTKLPDEKVKIKWNVSNTKHVVISGEGVNNLDKYPSSGTSVIGTSDFIQPGLSDSEATDHTYTITAYNIKDTSSPVSKEIKIRTRMPGAPDIPKFEFNEKDGILQTSEKGATLVWEVSSDAKKITLEGSGLPVPFETTSLTGSYTLKNLPVSSDPQGFLYTIRACPASGVNCFSKETRLKVFSSTALSATLTTGASLIKTGRSTTLSWEVAANDNIDSYTITSSDGEVDITKPATARIGTQTISPKQKTTYTITVKSVDPSLIPNYTGTAVVDVTDADVAGVQFSADKTEIKSGETATLTWSVSGAGEVSIDHEIGIVQSSGSQVVNPIFTTTYTLTAKSTAAIVPDVRKTVTIKVNNGTTVVPESITNETACIAAGYYWYDGSCHENAQVVVPSLPSFGEQPGAPTEQTTDLKVNGSDGPVTLQAPASFRLSWNLNTYCLATGDWLDFKLKAGDQNMSVKKNGKYVYSLYCPGHGSDSVEVNVVGGTGANANTGLLDSLSGKNSDALSNEPMPVAEAVLSTDKIAYSQNITVIKGQPTDIYIKTDQDVTGDGLASRDETGSWSELMISGGRCLYNTRLVKGTPQFDGMIESPASPQACSARLGSFVFNDEPGTYQYGIMRLAQNDNKFSNIAYVNITVENPPLPADLPIIDLRINNDDSAEQVLGTPANYNLTWNVTNADTCEASGAWNGAKFLQGVQKFVSSEAKDFIYTLTCVGKLGTTVKTIALRVMESPVCQFTALPPTINKSSAFITESELSWKCDYADECSMQPDVNTTIKTYGSVRISPSQTTTYELTCANSAASKKFETTVTVQ